MNKKQYNNVIEHTLKHEVTAQTGDSLETARAIFNNMGVALPQGDIKHVNEVIKSDDYMGWKSCTIQEAQVAANNGTAAIGISEDRIVVLAAKEEEEPVVATAEVMSISEDTSAYAVAGLSYYAYSNGTTVNVKENVTITRDGNSNKVIFEKTGKVWYCINHDLINDENYVNNMTLKNRSAKNLYMNYNEDDPLSSDTTVKRFTIDELKLLYTIDPYGVAHYVKRYADQKYDKIKDVVDYKDSVFRAFFGRNPGYYERTWEGVWYQFKGDIDLQFALSESEMYFGAHQIYDYLTIRDICDFIINIAGLIWGAIPFKDVAFWPAVERAGKMAIMAVSVGQSIVTSRILSGINGALLDISLDNTEIDWACNMVTFAADMEEIKNNIMSKPNFYKYVLNYCGYNPHYNVYLELKNGRKHKLNEICEDLNN